MLNAYNIALLSVPFDNSYTNTIRFDTRAEQAEYFALDTRFIGAPAVNLNIGTLLTTELVVNCNESIKLNPVMNYNYCIVKDNNPDADLPYYFYFVTQIRQQSGNQIRLNVELDVIQTYYIDLTFQDSLIEKAHIDRFVRAKMSNNLLINYNEKPIFLTPQINNDIPKRLTHQQKIYFQYAKTNSSPLNGFCNRIIDTGKMWLYIYMENSHAQELANLSPFYEDINAPFICFAAPIIIDLWSPTATYNNIDYKWNAALLLKAIKHKNLTPYVYSMKLSPLAPFKYMEYYEAYTGTDTALKINLSSDNEVIGGLNYSLTEWATVPAPNQILMCNVPINQFRDEDAPRYTMTLPNIKLTYLDEEVRTPQPINPNYNPALYTQLVREIRLLDYGGNSFSYDISKLNTTTITIKCIESFLPDITKGKLYIDLPSKIPYCEYSKGNKNVLTTTFFGLIYSNDTQYPFSIGQLETFLANNKNFQLQQAAQRDYNTRSGLANAAAGLANAAGSAAGAVGSGNVAGAVGAGVAGVANAANTMYQTYLTNELSRKNETFTLDNAQNAPDDLRNAQGNIYFLNSLERNAFYVELWEPLPIDLQRLNDYIHRYGYKIELIGNVKDYDHGRKYFNYIKCAIDTINGDISDTVHSKLRSIFMNGITMWHLKKLTDRFNYNIENYELIAE